MTKNKVFQKLLNKFPRLELNIETEERWSTQPIIFVSCDAVYFEKYVKFLALSLEKNSPGNIIHIHIINPTADSFKKLDFLHEKLKNTVLNYSYENKKFRSFFNRRLSIKKGNVYFACIRFVRICQLMDVYSAPIINVDADSIINNDLTLFLKSLADENYDVGLILRHNEQADKYKILASMCIFFQTELGRKFAEEYSILLMQGLRNKEKWFLDQIAIFRIYDKYKSSLKIFHIDQTIMYWDNFVEGVLIITAKGNNKISDKNYTEQIVQLKHEYDTN